MRIYVYSNYLYGRGGMETVIPMVCKNLMERGHEVKIILMNRSAFSDWTLGVPVICVESEMKQNHWQNNGNDTFGRILMLQEIFRRLPIPDVIVPVDIESIIPARNASEVYTNRPQIISWIHLSVKVLNHRENFKFADGHLSISKENVYEIRKIDEHGSIHLVYNPVLMKTKFVPRPAIANFIFLGRLSYGKRLDRMLYALADISGDWTLQVIGEGEDGPYFKRLAEELGLNHRIIWEGWQSKPWEVVKEANALLLTSDYEGLPMCIIEAHAHGIPVIAGDCPTGPAEIIQNGINGWLYPYQDVIALSSILEGVVQKGIPLPSHELVKQTASDYDVEKVVDRIEQAFLQECKSNIVLENIKRKICFAILVHENRDVIKDQLENIRYFCPTASIVFFQSGNDPNLCEGFGYPVCPTSFPMKWGKTFGWFFLNVMEWLEKIGYEYDYLINIDSDVLFAKKGFEKFIISEMEHYDYMAPYFSEAHDDWIPGQTMKRVWHLWQPIFNMNNLYRCFGSQVFSRTFIKQILSFNKLDEMKSLMKHTEEDVFALEEMLFPTLAKTLDVKAKAYPVNVSKLIRDVPIFTEEEIRNGVNNNEQCYLIHPVRRIMNDPARTLIRNMIR